MVSKKETLDKLNEEKEYEDKLVNLLFGYYIDCIDGISDIESEDKIKIKKILSTIATDSKRHSHMFNELVHMVFENEKDNY